MINSIIFSFYASALVYGDGGGLFVFRTYSLASPSLHQERTMCEWGKCCVNISGTLFGNNLMSKSMYLTCKRANI